MIVARLKRKKKNPSDVALEEEINEQERVLLLLWTNEGSETVFLK